MYSYIFSIYYLRQVGHVVKKERETSRVVTYCCEPKAHWMRETLLLTGYPSRSLGKEIPIKVYIHVVSPEIWPERKCHQSFRNAFMCYLLGFAGLTPNTHATITIVGTVNDETRFHNS